MKSKRVITLCLLSIAVVMGLVAFSLRQDFDAEAYVRATIEHAFSGETEELAKIVTNVDEEYLRTSYEESMRSFVVNNILNHESDDQEVEDQFLLLTKEFFKGLQYEVHPAKKISQQEYEVDVEYAPTDLFLQFVASMEVEQKLLKEKVEKGEYQGTKEEIEAQMKQDVIQNRYQTLQNACEQQQISEKMVMTFHVTSDSNRVFSIEQEEITRLMEKILRLDEIQD